MLSLLACAHAQEGRAAVLMIVSWISRFSTGYLLLLDRYSSCLQASDYLGFLQYRCIASVSLSQGPVPLQVSIGPVVGGWVGTDHSALSSVCS